MNIRDNKFASYKLFEQALAQKGYRLDFKEDYPATATYVSPQGKIWTTRAARMTYPFNTQEAYSVARDKSRAYELAKSAGFPTPHSTYVTDTVTDDELAAMLGKFDHLVVKPVDLAQSRGLTIDIDSLEKLRRAVQYGFTFSPSLVVQQQVSGEEVRFTVINGKVEAALLRRTARVIGNGSSTIAELIADENEARSKLQFEMITYPQLDKTLIDPELLTSNRIPAEGEVVELNRSTMVKGGCSVYEVSDQVHPSYRQQVEDLAARLGARFVVVDVFCEDYTRPAAEGNYWFIEFNTAPALRLYYSCRDGKQFDIVGRLADEIDRYLRTQKD